MAKILFGDTSDVEPGKDFDNPIPKGLYKMRVKEIEDTTSNADGRPMLKVTLEVADGDHKGRLVWDYIKYKDDTSQWKVAQFKSAVGLSEGKVEIDPAQIEGTIVLVKIKHEGSVDDDYGIQSKVASMVPVPEDEAEEMETAETESDNGDGGDEEEELTVDDVNAMNKAELKDLIEEQEVSGVRVTKKSKVANVRAKVIEALGLEEATEDLEVPEDWDGLAELGEDDLIAITEAEDMEVDVSKMEDEDALRSAVAGELGIDVPDDDEEVAYADMEVADLRSACSERGLATKGGKKALIKRLEADDESGDEGSGDEPF
jgi:hypothetical protein